MSSVKVTNLLHGSSASNNIVLASDGTTTVPELKATTELLVGGVSTTANGGTLQISNGITFPATQSACSNVNTLDDYEEGDWTVQLQDVSGNNATMEAAYVTATYVKIGRQVTVTGTCYTSSISGLSGSVRIAGLPFVVAIGTKFVGAAAISGEQQLNITSGQKLSARINSNTTNLRLYISNSAAGGNFLTSAEWSSDGFAEFTATYFTT